MNVIVYTLPSCSSCVNSKKLLDSKNVYFTETVIGKDILREDFVELFPEQKTAPLIVIDGVKIGGYDELREYLDNKPELLAE
jgi:glutaredoxin